MAKKKSDEQEVEPVEQQEAAAESQPAEDAKPAVSSEVLAKVISDTNEEIRRFMPHLKASEQEHRDAADAAKEAKKTMEGNHLHLSMLCGRIADAMNGKYQPLLFDAESKPLRQEDPGAAMDVGVLKDHGLTEKMVETLVEHELTTIGKLESAMRADEWWHKKIKGFGDERVERLIDALTLFRAAHPVPQPDDEPLAEQVASALDDAGILAK